MGSYNWTVGVSTDETSLAAARHDLEYMIRYVDVYRKLGFRNSHVIALIEMWTKVGDRVAGNRYHVGVRSAWRMTYSLRPLEKERWDALTDALEMLTRVSDADDVGRKRRFHEAELLMLEFVYEYRRKLKESAPKEAADFAAKLMRHEAYAVKY